MDCGSLRLNTKGNVSAFVCGMDSGNLPDDYLICRICEKRHDDQTTLVEHLRIEHDLLEIAAYAATTMAKDQERDRVAQDFHMRLDRLRRELAGQRQKEQPPSSTLESGA